MDDDTLHQMHPNSASAAIRNFPKSGPREGGPTLYTAGLLFSYDLSAVALVTKQRPDWQAGKLNAIGGRTEPGESPIETQIREFREETGCEILAWKAVCRMVLQEQWEVNFFAAFGDYPIRQMTDELVAWYRVSDVVTGVIETIPNLRWLLPMALQGDVIGEIYVDPALTHQRG